MFTRIRFSVTLNGKPPNWYTYGLYKNFLFKNWNENDLLLIPKPFSFPLGYKTRFHLFSMGFQSHCNLTLSHFPGFFLITAVPPPNPHHLNLEFITHSPSLYWHLCWLSLLVKVFHILTYSLQICIECLILWGWPVWGVRCWRHRPETWMRPCGVGLRLTCRWFSHNVLKTLVDTFGKPHAW